MSGRSGLYLQEIDGVRVQELSGFKVEFEAGEYTLKFKFGKKAGFAGAFASGAVGGMAAANVYIYGVNRSDGDPLEIRMKLKAGHLYVANHFYTADQTLAVSITEL